MLKRREGVRTFLLFRLSVLEKDRFLTVTERLFGKISEKICLQAFLISCTDKRIEASGNC